MAKKRSWFVTMTDTFMSGWGMARGKKSKLVIGPMKWDDALQIEKAARRRPEMKYVNIRERKGKPDSWYPYDRVDVKKLSQIGGSWKTGSYWRGKK